MKGFYFAAEFEKGRKPCFMFVNEKPFEFDTVEGTVTGKALPTVGRRSCLFPTDWTHINGKASQIHKDKALQDEINMYLEQWCKKHKRKFEPLEWDK